MEYSFIPFEETSNQRFGGADLEGRKFNDGMIGLQPNHFNGSSFFSLSPTQLE